MQGRSRLLRPLFARLASLLYDPLNTWHLWHSQFIAILSFCCSCTCSSVVLQVEWCHLHHYTCSKNVQLSYILSPAASTCLTLMEIENELSEVTATDWYPLGVQLGLRPPTLREILNTYPLDTERCKQEVLHVWLCSTPEASWKSLAQAVQALGRYESLVQKLRRKVPPGPKG